MVDPRDVRDREKWSSFGTNAYSRERAKKRVEFKERSSSQTRTHKVSLPLSAIPLQYALAGGDGSIYVFYASRAFMQVRVAYMLSKCTTTHLPALLASSLTAARNFS